MTGPQVAMTLVALVAATIGLSLLLDWFSIRKGK